MVDPKDLFFVECRSQLRVELARGFQVVAQRFLDDDPPRLIALGGHAGLADGAEDVREGLRWRGQVEDRGRGSIEHRLDGAEARRVAVVDLHPLGGGGELGASARFVYEGAELL